MTSSAERLTATTVEVFWEPWFEPIAARCRPRARVEYGRATLDRWPHVALALPKRNSTAVTARRDFALVPRSTATSAANCESSACPMRRYPGRWALAQEADQSRWSCIATWSARSAASLGRQVRCLGRRYRQQVYTPDPDLVGPSWSIKLRPLGNLGKQLNGANFGDYSISSYGYSRRPLWPAGRDAAADYRFGAKLVTISLKKVTSF
jgi:hypothetical protein